MGRLQRVHRGKARGLGSRSGTAPWAVVGAAAVLLAAVVLAAGVAAPWQLEDRPFDLLELGMDRATDTEEPPPEPADVDEPPPPQPPVDANLTWVTVLAVLLGVAAGVVLARWLWRRRRTARPTDEPTLAEVDHEVAPHLGADTTLPGLRDAATAARRSLASIDHPGDAVITAWVTLEEAASTSGVPRSPAQTPTEFTVAVLERTDADPDAVADLLGLYHRARFSTRPVGTDEVRRATRCLDRLAASWDALPAATADTP